MDYFHTALQEDFHRTYVETQARFSAQRVISLKNSVSVLGGEFRQYIDCLLGLTDLIGRSGSYVTSWILEFYATVWINPDHLEIAFSFLGQRVDISSARAREILRIPHNANKIHRLCFPDAEPPRRTHIGVLPLVKDMHPCFRGDFGEGSSRLPTDITSTARALDSIVRRTILPREGFREGFTRLQQWIVSHLVRRLEFDI